MDLLEMTEDGLEQLNSSSMTENGTKDFEKYIMEYDLEALANGALDHMFESGLETCQYHLSAKRKCKPCTAKKLETNLGFCKVHTANYVNQIRREIEARDAKKEKQHRAKLIDINCKDSVEQGRELAKEETQQLAAFNDFLRQDLEKDEISLLGNNGVKIEDDDDLEDCQPLDNKIWIEKTTPDIDTGGDEEDFEVVEWNGKSKVAINHEVDDEQTIMQKLAYMEEEKACNTARQSLNIDLAKTIYFDTIGYMCLKSGKTKMYGLPKALREHPSTKKLFGQAMKDLASDMNFDWAGLPSYGTLAMTHGYIALKMFYS